MGAGSWLSGALRCGLARARPVEGGYDRAPRATRREHDRVHGRRSSLSRRDAGIPIRLRPCSSANEARPACRRSSSAASDRGSGRATYRIGKEEKAGHVITTFEYPNRPKVFQIQWVAEFIERLEKIPAPAGTR